MRGSKGKLLSLSSIPRTAGPQKLRLMDLEVWDFPLAPDS